MEGRFLCYQTVEKQVSEADCSIIIDIELSNIGQVSSCTTRDKTLDIPVVERPSIRGSRMRGIGYSIVASGGEVFKAPISDLAHIEQPLPSSSPTDGVHRSQVVMPSEGGRMDWLIAMSAVSWESTRPWTG